ncbi:PspC domain-containing protein [Georgenia alba]|uniref:PspC domain-containing protein n=1 Tax=Georgenia alba TaxID=2233858 RepID=A0ABW2QDC4_9MICO
MSTSSGRDERPETPPPGTPGGQHSTTSAPPAASFFDSLRRTGLRRTEPRWFGGVAGGLARRLDIDPLLVRGVLVVMTFFGGLGVLLYGLGWALLPEERDGRIHLQEALRGNVDGALAGAAVFLIIGLARPIFWWDEDGYWIEWFLPTLVVTALAALLLAVLIRRRDRRDAAGPQPAEPHATPAAGAGASESRAAGQDGPVATAVPGSGGGPTPAQAPEGAGETAYGRVAYSAAPSPTAPPPPPRKPVVPGPGRATVAVVLAACLLLAAALVVWDRIAPVTGGPEGLWLAGLLVTGAMLVALGAGVAVSGLRGRRGRGLAVLGVLLALAVAPWTVTATVAPAEVTADWRGTSGAAFGAQRFEPVTAGNARDGFSLAGGDLVVDLTELDRAGQPGGGPVSVPVNVGAGSARLVVPDGAAVLVDVELGGGQVVGDTGGGWSGPAQRAGAPDDGSLPRLFEQGGSVQGTYLSPEAQDGRPELVVDLKVGFGTISIQEEQ